MEPTRGTKMVIAHVFASESWGGAEIYSLELAEAQTKAGQNILFWATPGSKLAQEAKNRGVELIEERLPPRVDFLAVFRIRKILKAKKITHVHLHWSGGVWTFSFVKKLISFHLIYHVHLWMKHKKRDPLHWQLYKNVDQVIVAGKRAREAVLKCLPVHEYQVSICPYARHFSHVQDPSITRESLHIPEGQTVFGVFARLDRQKGILEFLEALKMIMTSKNNPRRDFFALIVGDPTAGEQDALNYQMELQGFGRIYLQGHVQFLNHQDDYLSYLNLCDVLVAPSYHESYSLMFLDAFLLGKPVISTAAGGTPDLIQSSSGWLVPPRDVPSLAQVLSHGMAHPREFQQKGESAREYVVAYHSFEKVLNCMNDIYAKVLIQKKDASLTV
jgi:glycosyltransferase involved in cell wall biosynthesis